MKRSLLTMLGGVVVASCLASTPAEARVSIQIFPSATYRSTARPIYYQNRATYWYGGRWHYRDGRGWRTYRTEPRYLRNRRNQQQQRQREYYRRDRW